MKRLVTQPPHDALPPEYKLCNGCGEVKLRSEYHARKTRPSGIMARCKACCQSYKRANAKRILEVRRQREASQPGKKSAAGKAYYAANRDAVLARTRAHYAANKEAYRKRHAAWWDNNPHYSREWREKNREHIQVFWHARRAKKTGAAATLTTDQWRAVIAAYGHRCAYCRKKTKLEQDHVLALARGGTHSADNVVPACRACNAHKLANPPTLLQLHLIR